MAKASNTLWISGGRIIDPANNRDESGDIFIADGKIAPDMSAAQKKKARRIEADGLVVCPGLVDIHVHLREPGQTHKESIASGSRAAAAGGFTSIVCMPNTMPPADNVGTIQQIKDAIERDAVVNVYPTGCITSGMQGESLAPIGSLKNAGVVAITDDGSCVQNNEIMRNALKYAHMFDLVVMDHCQDYALTNGAVMNEGIWSLRLGLIGWPNSAEDIIVNRNVILSAYTGARLHLQHITSAYSVEVIRRAKARNVPVTAEACPHHLHLTDECLKNYDTNFKMNPPLRTEDDRQALIEGLQDGAIDCIATDHAPHTDYEKDVEFDYAPFGVIGLETALAVSLEALVHTSQVTLPQLLGWLTFKPSDILNLDKGNLSPGADADVIIFDPEEAWTVSADHFQSQSKNSPWVGRTLKGKVKHTLVAGKIVWDGERITTPAQGD